MNSGRSSVSPFLAFTTAVFVYLRPWASLNSTSMRHEAPWTKPRMLFCMQQRVECVHKPRAALARAECADLSPSWARSQQQLCVRCRGKDTGHGSCERLRSLRARDASDQMATTAAHDNRTGDGVERGCVHTPTLLSPHALRPAAASALHLATGHYGRLRHHNCARLEGGLCKSLGISLHPKPQSRRIADKPHGQQEHVAAALAQPRWRIDVARTAVGPRGEPLARPCPTPAASAAWRAMEQRLHQHHLCCVAPTQQAPRGLAPRSSFHAETVTAADIDAFMPAAIGKRQVRSGGCAW